MQTSYTYTAFEIEEVYGIPLLNYFRPQLVILQYPVEDVRLFVA